MKVHCCLIILLMAATIYSKYSDHRHGDNDYRHRDKNFRHGDNNYRHRDDNIRHRDKYYNGQCKIMARTPQQWVDALNVFIYQNRDGNVCASEDLVIRLAKYPNNQQLQLSSIDPSESFWTLVGDGNSLNQMNEIRELRAEGISSAKEIKEGLLRKTIDRIGKKIHKKLQTNTSQKWFFHVISKRAIRKLISSQSYDFFIPSWDNLFRYMEYFVYCKWVDGKDMCDEDHPISVKFHPSIKRGLKEKSLEEIIGCSEGVVRCCDSNRYRRDQIDRRYSRNRRDSMHRRDSRYGDSIHRSDNRHRERRYGDSRHRSNSRYEDSRHEDRRYEDSRHENSRYEDSRFENSRYEDSRYEDSMHRSESRYGDSRHGYSRHRRDSRDRKNPLSQFCMLQEILSEKGSNGGGKIEAVKYYASIQHGRTLPEARAFFYAVFEFYPNDNDRMVEGHHAEMNHNGVGAVLIRGDINMYDMKPTGASLFLTST